MALIQQFDISQTIALGTLGSGAMIRDPSKIDGNRRQGFRIVQTDLFVTMTGKTTAEGPLLLGIDMNFDSSTKVLEALAADPQGKTSDTARGKGTYLKILDSIGLVPTVFPASDEGTGKHYKIMYGKNGWTIPEGNSWNLWIRNNFGSALTSGTSIKWDAEHFGVWLSD